MPQSMHGPGSHVAAADQTTDPDGGLGADAEALIRSLGVTVGDRLDGRYRLERVLHTTGPAITWLAADEKLNRPNRIHLLRSDQPRAEAFMAAARAAAAMPDNHFVQVLDAVPDEGLYYVITEWLHDGHTLGEVLSGGPVPVTEAVRITSELARAMTEAHDQGLAHLRLSPKTVLRTDTGEVKILDLCLAAALTGTVARDPMGTDLGAIGELAYALLTGKRPQQPDPVPPSELRPEVSPQLDEVILRILGDGPAGPQFRTPTEVADALAQLPRPRYEAPLPSTPQTAPLRHQQTTVMPAMTGDTSRTSAMPQVEPSYQQAQAAPACPPRHGAPQRPSSHDEHEYRPRGGGSGGGYGGSRGSGGDGGRNSSTLIIVGAIAAVVAVALLAYTMFNGSGTKNKANAGSTGTSSGPTSTTGSSQAPASTDITPAAVSVYDEDGGTRRRRLPDQRPDRQQGLDHQPVLLRTTPTLQRQAEEHRPDLRPGRGQDHHQRDGDRRYRGRGDGDADRRRLGHLGARRGRGPPPADFTKAASADPRQHHGHPERQRADDHPLRADLVHQAAACGAEPDSRHKVRLTTTATATATRSCP